MEETTIHNTTGGVIEVPTIYVIFGVTGDLSLSKLLPALLGLYIKKALPQKFKIVGFSRRHFSPQEFRRLIFEEMMGDSDRYPEYEFNRFLDHVVYQQGFFDKPESYVALAERLAEIDKQFKQCSNKLFHLSVSPSFYETVLQNLASSGLTIPCGGNLGWTRVLVEKPFGNDTETAAKLDLLLGKLFKEEQIFRIDHYLAKESVQNILAFRFANSLFEPLWNSKFIDQVEIKLLEKKDVHDRGDFYDNVGALKDVGQNHMLQMLALVAMEQPDTLSSDAIRRERTKVLKKLDPITPKMLPRQAVRGQYEGYLKEQGVDQHSVTETYFKLAVHVSTKRWKGVPFFLESGKALAENKVEINVYFKNEIDPYRKNVLTMRIQPDEGIKILFWVKLPGFGMNLVSKTLAFKYSDFPGVNSIPDAYERVLYDAVVGDQTLFTSTDEVHYAWKFITPIVLNWDSTPLIPYKKNSSGPVSE
jgi:glucose-6-phosphate 1-dehydrogenase